MTDLVELGRLLELAARLAAVARVLALEIRCVPGSGGDAPGEVPGTVEIALAVAPGYAARLAAALAELDRAEEAGEVGAPTDSAALAKILVDLAAAWWSVGHGGFAPPEAES